MIFILSFLILICNAEESLVEKDNEIKELKNKVNQLSNIIDDMRTPKGVTYDYSRYVKEKYNNIKKCDKFSCYINNIMLITCASFAFILLGLFILALYLLAAYCQYGFYYHRRW